MSQTLFAMAVVQALVPMLALLVWPPRLTTGVAKEFGFNFVFVLLFVAAGLLFRRAASTVSDDAMRAA